MKTIRLLPVRSLAVLTAGLTLSACAMPWQVCEVQDAKDITATAGTPFTQALTENYKAQAAYESEAEQEWRHALIFARKAERTATGEAIAPEDPAAWELPAEAGSTLLAARGRLVGYFEHGARERVPAAAAKAQAAFDCWLEEEWEGDSDDTCKKAFLAAEPELQPPPPPPVAHKPTVIKTFVVYFDFNSAKLTRKAKTTILEVAVAQQALHPTAIYVVGHTDTMGGSDYNMRLSQRRAQAVADGLDTVGVEAKILDVKAVGKTDLAVPTKDHVRKAENRRVVITFEK